MFNVFVISPIHQCNWKSVGNKIIKGCISWKCKSIYQINRWCYVIFLWLIYVLMLHRNSLNEHFWINTPGPHVKHPTHFIAQGLIFTKKYFWLLRSDCPTSCPSTINECVLGRGEGQVRICPLRFSGLQWDGGVWWEHWATVTQPAETRLLFDYIHKFLLPKLTPKTRTAEEIVWQKIRRWHNLCMCCIQ